MSELKPITTSRSLELGDNFDGIRNKINNCSRYVGLKNLCKFYPEENRIEYYTERIHPNHSEHPARIPILLLFSNPHPDSVRHGLFLSGPHSRSFWQRLFESNRFCLPLGEINLEHWDESTPKMLGQLMSEGKYKSKFLLYFHCLWQVPTNQVADLRRLFVSKSKALWRKLNEDAQRELAELVENEQIKHIVAFTGEVFHLITQANKVDYKGRRDLIRSAVDDFLKDKDIEKYWNTLSFCRAKAGFSNDVDVYLSLDTRSKNLKIEGTKKRYFTFALDMILERILKNLGAR